MVVDSGVLEGGGCWVRNIQASLPPAAAASKAATAHCIIVSYCQMMAMVSLGATWWRPPTQWSVRARLPPGQHLPHTHTPKHFNVVQQSF